MDNKALYNLSYGVFFLATKSGDKVNACITNTCIQVANSPTRIAIAVLNTNYTCDLIKESGEFAISLLDQSITFDEIKHFGMQSGRDVNKFEGRNDPVTENGIPYLAKGACSLLTAKVCESVELGSHTLFIAELTDAKLLSDLAPVTYADYQSKIKPKPQEVSTDKEIVSWKCKICGYIYEGKELPKDYACPLCGHGPEDFEPVYK